MRPSCSSPRWAQLYYGKVVRILQFGAFVELAPGKDGMVHISKLADHRVEKVEDVVNIGDMIWVKVTDIDEKGRVNLSPIRMPSGRLRPRRPLVNPLSKFCIGANQGPGPHTARDPLSALSGSCSKRGKKSRGP